jgi:hypothetical protein
MVTRIIPGHQPIEVVMAAACVFLDKVARSKWDHRMKFNLSFSQFKFIGTLDMWRQAEVSSLWIARSEFLYSLNGVFIRIDFAFNGVDLIARPAGAFPRLFPDVLSRMADQSY